MAAKKDQDRRDMRQRDWESCWCMNKSTGGFITLLDQRVLENCISCFSIAEKQFMDEGVYLGLQVIGSESMMVVRSQRVGDLAATCLEGQARSRESALGTVHGSKTSKPPPPRDVIPPARPHLLNFPNSATHWGPSAPKPAPTGDILIQTATRTTIVPNPVVRMGTWSRATAGSHFRLLHLLSG